MFKRNNKCSHIWEEESRQFAQINPNKLKHMDNKPFTDDEEKRISNMILLGATSILLRCEKCGDFMNRVVEGDHT